MRIIGNLLWLIFGGLLHGLLWTVFGVLLCVTVIGIPFGIQCFKLAGLQLAPFGKRIDYRFGSGMGVLGNIIWILVCGWELALANVVSAAFFAVTIVGIPFAIQSLKMAQLSLMPFGATIVTERYF